MANEQTAIVRDVVQRLNHLPTRSIARYLLSMYGGMFENNLEGRKWGRKQGEK